MSTALPSSTAAFTPQGTRNGSSDHEAFHRYFERWLSEQNRHLQDLISAANSDADDDGVVLRPLLNRVIRHYEGYYEAKSDWEKRDVFSMFSPSWRSSLEDAFLWIGGWRPTTAFHLLYSKSGIQLESGLEDLLRGLTTGDLGDLSPDQFNRIDDLHRETVAEEREIEEKFAKQQESVADKSMVELSHLDEAAGEETESRVEAAVEEKKAGMEEVIRMADDLRLRTLKEAVNEILTPLQAVHFLIAAAELHLRLHDWGKKKDNAAAAGARMDHHVNGVEQRQR